MIIVLYGPIDPCTGRYTILLGANARVVGCAAAKCDTRVMRARACVVVVSAFIIKTIAVCRVISRIVVLSQRKISEILHNCPPLICVCLAFVLSSHV